LIMDEEDFILDIEPLNFSTVIAYR
jgi:hypothetical protein